MKSKRMGAGAKCRRALPFLFLGALGLFFCWFFVGRYGIFGSNVDWISQHSVIPDYFRQQFYETGNLFPEFAANIGGGQNIYNFSYYGLFHPVILISYLLPFVKMGDYLMGASIVSLVLSAELFYGWLLKRGFSGSICFMTALMYLLSGPMIFHSYCQIMFVNYMPFLCMAFLGVDRYFETGGKLLYTVSVFLMILASFYFSIGGMLTLVLYGIYRYVECADDAGIPAGGGKNDAGIPAEGEKDDAGILAGGGKADLLRGKETGELSGGKNIGGGSLHTVTCVCSGIKKVVCYVVSGRSKKDSADKNIVCDVKTEMDIKEIKKYPAAKNIAWNLKFGWIKRFFVRDRRAHGFAPEVTEGRTGVVVAPEGMEGRAGFGVVPEGMEGRTGRRITVIGFLCDGIRFLQPMLTAVLMSGILLIPTAAALAGREGSRASVSLASLWIPNIQMGRLLYTPYGIGLPTLMITVLAAGFGYKERKDRVLSWGCAVLLAVPFFSWALNGGLYVRDKALIPCLPLLCYLIACYLKKLQEKRISFVMGAVPYVITLGLLWAEQVSAGASEYTELFLLDGAIMGGCFLLYWRRKQTMILMLPPVVFLVLFGSMFHEQAGRIESREFYEKVNDPAIGQAIGDILAEDRGFYRLELVGNETENAAELNRVRTMGQYISSLYSSSYNREYQEFRKTIFEVEEPFRNDLMQSVSRNPLFLQFMGVRYLISEREVPGYERIGNAGDRGIYQNLEAAPAVYATDRMLSEQAYRGLEFPYNQMALAYAAVRPDREGGAGDDGESKGEAKAGRENAMVSEDVESMDAAEIQQEAAGYMENRNQEAVLGKMDRQILEEVRQALKPVEFVLPAQNGDSLEISEMREGYRIRAEQKSTVQIDLSGSGGGDAAEKDRVLFCRFRVKNYNSRIQDVTVWLEGERNKLTARDHFYYNGNTIFSYAVVLEKGKTSAELSLGKGEYEISDLTCYMGDWEKSLNRERSSRLYRSEFHPDPDRTKGNVIAGSVDVEEDGYFVTSIPYDSNFEVRVDGKAAEYGKVNLAFLGFSIGKGSHDVELVYHAPGRTAGAWCSVVGAAALLFLLKKRRI